MVDSVTQHQTQKSVAQKDLESPVEPINHQTLTIPDKTQEASGGGGDTNEEVKNSKVQTIKTKI